MERYKIYAIPIDSFIVAEAVELAHAIYDKDEETLQGWADYLIDEATEAMAAAGVDADIIGVICSQAPRRITDA